MMSRLSFLSPILILLLCLGGFCFPAISQAAEVQITEAKAQWRETEGLRVQAKFDFDLPSRLEDLLQKGIPLYFVVEFNLKKPRRYWWDDDVVTAQYEWRLSYHASTRRYRLSRQNLHYNFATLREALATIKTVRYWTVIDQIELSKDTKYSALIRFHLDENQLPKLFQVTPMASASWRLDSGWQSCRLIFQ